MSKFLKILIIILVVLGVLIAGLVFFSKPAGNNKIVNTNQDTGILEAEKQQIEAWLLENNLNRYGDPKEMMYTGGTPLFNERTGQSIDRYEYILRNHPDRPWLK